MRKESRYFAYVSFIFIGIVIGVVLTTQLDFHQKSDAADTTRLINSNFKLPDLPRNSNKVDDFSKRFIEINKKVTPSIVSITAIRRISVEDLKRFHEDQDQDFWEKFYRRFNPFRDQEEFRRGASGSGIIVHPDGYILTNTHVVRNASELSVTLFDNRQFTGRIVGVDSLTEVAVIKIEGEDLPVARLGNSDDVQVGQWVVAIGNPLELRFTVTAGIVSAIGRQMSIIGDRFGIENFIQTDAVINPGNSGGALVDLNGDVIGVNTAIATRSGYYEGYGFAIPINLAKAVMQDLITKGRVIRAYLGIAMLPMDDRKARAYGLDKPVGVFIDNILPDGPAGKAGIKAEDIILAVDDVEIHQANQVQSYIAQKDPGDEIVIKVLRAGKTLKIPVVLGERDFGGQIVRSEELEQKNDKFLGLEVRSLTKKEAREQDLPDSQGVVVDRVEPYGTASEAGLYRNDVILELNGKIVKNKDDFWRRLKKMNSGEVARLLIKRGASQTHIFVEIP